VRATAAVKTDWFWLQCSSFRSYQFHVLPHNVAGDSCHLL
jgi:hypothetical protein